MLKKIITILPLALALSSCGVGPFKKSSGKKKSKTYSYNDSTTDGECLEFSEDTYKDMNPYVQAELEEKPCPDRETVSGVEVARYASCDVEDEGISFRWIGYEYVDSDDGIIDLTNYTEEEVCNIVKAD